MRKNQHDYQKQAFVFAKIKKQPLGRRDVHLRASKLLQSSFGCVYLVALSTMVDGLGDSFRYFQMRRSAHCFGCSGQKPPYDLSMGEDSLVSSGVRSFDKAGDYEIPLTDSAGCSQSHTIHLRSEECSPILEIPNVFTPNNDGSNDVLKVKTQEQIFDFKMQIFTSWGLKVYDYSGEGCLAMG